MLNLKDDAANNDPMAVGTSGSGYAADNTFTEVTASPPEDKVEMEAKKAESGSQDFFSVDDLPPYMV